MGSFEYRIYAENGDLYTRQPRAKGTGGDCRQGALMKHLRHPAEPGTERRQQPGGPGRRGFLRQAGLAAIVVGGLETLGIPQATAGTTGRRSIVPPGKIVPPSKNVGAVYPRAGKPGPDIKSIVVKPDGSCNITWYCSPGNCGSGCPDSEGCYFWYDSCNGQYGGPTCAWSNCATHVQRV